MIGLFPIDMERMVTFYKELLGVEVDWDGKSPYTEFKHEGIRFAMYARGELAKLLGKQPDFTRGTNGIFELAVDLPHFEDVDPEYQQALSLVPARSTNPAWSPGGCVPPWSATRKAI
jgi:catechol 2,3-dioxygenase-like lactoylglutathione lyase family enzyme